MASFKRASKVPLASALTADHDRLKCVAPLLAIEKLMVSGRRLAVVLYRTPQPPRPREVVKMTFGTDTDESDRQQPDLTAAFLYSRLRPPVGRNIKHLPKAAMADSRTIVPARKPDGGDVEIGVGWWYRPLLGTAIIGWLSEMGHTEFLDEAPVGEPELLFV